MKSIKITFGPVPYFLMPRLLGTEHRKPAEVGRAEALPLRKCVECVKNHRAKGVPACFFSPEGEALHDRSFAALFRDKGLMDP